MPIFALHRLFLLIKRHWKPLLVILAVGTTLFLYIMKEDGWTKRYKELQKIHDEEIHQIEKARQVEKLEHEKIEAELKQRLDQIQKNYQKGQADLAAARRREQARILDKFRGNPQGLAEELSSVTGWRIIK